MGYKEDVIYIAGLTNDSVVDGPGLRYCVFLQGCPLRCEGCHNPQTQEFSGGKEYGATQIFELIDGNKLLEGVTFSGGEPMCQAVALLPLAKLIKQKGLNLAVYTGFVFERLTSKQAPKGVKDLLEYVDILIDGPFIIEQKEFGLKFKGSKNQRIIDVKLSLEKKEAVLTNDKNWL